MRSASHVTWIAASIAAALMCCVGYVGCADSDGPVSIAQAAEDSEKPASGQADTEDQEAPAKEAPSDEGEDAGETEPGDEAVAEHPFPRNIDAPPLDGGISWINSSGPLEIRDLRGKFVLLDFWTYCCINCIHILPELKKLEQAYPNELVVIGVHSAKFDTEQDTQNITDAVLRYEIEHPVVNDAEHAIWDAYSVNSWPSLRIVDPEGKLVAGHSGEIDFETLDKFLKSALPYYKKKGVLDETPLRFELEAYAADKTPLRFPGKVLADEAGDRLYISDSNHNRIVVTKLDGTLVETIGSGVIGAADGGFESASFHHPQGMAIKDRMLYLADTENHLLRKIDLKKKEVMTIAGMGEQGRNAWPGLEQAALLPPSTPTRFVGPPKETAINSPWALLIEGLDLYIAMAGPHQIWKMPLDESEIGPYAGNGREDIVDGPLLPKQPYQVGYSSFAQPSGLASDGTWLYVADSEGSSIRAVPFDPTDEVRTVVGTAHLPGARLFTFGDVDGDGKNARLQHALGVAFYQEKLYVADTYNNKLKVVDPTTGQSKTLVGTGKPGSQDEPATFDEPAGIAAAADKLYVADTNNHLIRVVDLANGNKVSTLVIEGLKPPAIPKSEHKPSFRNSQEVSLELQKIRPGESSLELAVTLKLPEGFKINDEAPTSYKLEATGNEGPVDRAAIGKSTRLKAPAAEFAVSVPLKSVEGNDTVSLALTYYYCQEGEGGLCKVGNVVWTIPLELSPSAEQTAVPLELVVK